MPFNTMCSMPAPVKISLRTFNSSAIAAARILFSASQRSKRCRTREGTMSRQFVVSSRCLKYNASPLRSSQSRVLFQACSSKERQISGWSRLVFDELNSFTIASANARFTAGPPSRDEYSKRCGRKPQPRMDLHK